METETIKIEEIRKKIDTQKYLNWNEVYLDLKYLSELSEDKIDCLLMIQVAELSLKFGLSVESGKEEYLDVIELLASYHCQIGQYEKAQTEFQSILDINPYSPIWIRYGLLNADIHTDIIRRILRKPYSYIDFFETDDGEDDAGKQVRQQNILKDLFSSAADYVNKNPETEINLEALSIIAKKYLVFDSSDYKMFLAALNGEEPENIYAQQVEADYKRLFENQKNQNETLSFEKANLSSQNEALSQKLASVIFENSAKDKQITELLKANQESEGKAKKDQELAQKAQKDFENLILKKAKDDAQMNEILLKSQKAYEDSQKKIKEMISEKEQMAKALKEIQDRVISLNKDLAQVNEELLKEKAIPKTVIKQESKPKSAYMVVAEYLQLCTNLLSVWLKTSILRGNNQNDWNRYVVPNLNPKDLQKRCITKIEEVDFSTMCYICNKNKSSLGNYYFEVGQYQNSMVFQNMIEVRNHFAHYSQSDSDKVFFNDLQYIKKFLDILNCDYRYRTKLDEYIRQLGE